MQVLYGELTMIVVCGELVLDVMRVAGEDSRHRPVHFAAYPGGSPANTAVALARLGCASALCARISRQTPAWVLREHLERNGVDLRFAVEADEPASLAFVDLDAQATPTYSFYVEGTADWQWRPGELPESFPDDVSALHVGSLASWTEPGCHAIAAMLERERGARLCSLDPNIRPRLMASVASSRRWIESLVGCVHLVKASDEDVAWLYPGSSIDDTAQRWLELGAHVVIITLGQQGAVGFTSKFQVHRPAVSGRVVDTVGAGDSFAAAVLHFLDTTKLTTAVRSGRLEASSLAAALEFAAAVAAVTCSRAGANPPFASEVPSLHS